MYQRLGYYCRNLGKVTIKTHSVYIIQCTPSQCCKIVGSKEEFESELPNEQLNGAVNLTGRMYTSMVGGIIDASKLNVLHGF